MGVIVRPFWPNTAALLFVCISSFFTGGCATIFGGKTTMIRFESKPTGAKIRVTNGGGGCKETPCQLELKGDRTYVAIAQLKGYDDRSKLISRKIRKISWLNFLQLIYFWVGYGIDYFSDSLYYLTPEKVVITLPESVPEASEDSEGNELSVIKYQRLPYTPALERIKERFSDAEVMAQVLRYRGGLRGQALWRAVDQIYLILVELEAEGERLDIDEAFRRAAFMNDRPIKKNSVDE